MSAPPLGVMPKSIWEEKVIQDRIFALLMAIYRYSVVEKPVPVDWVIELSELLEYEE